MKRFLRRSPLFRLILAPIALLLPASAVQAREAQADASLEETAAPIKPDAGTTEAPAIVRPALWKIADEDTTIWLFGTVHILPPGIDWLKGPVASALDGSEQLVTEILDPGPGEMAALIADKATRAPGTTLRETLEPTERAEYEAALQSLSVPVTMFDRYDAWYAAVGLSTLPLMQLGYASENGVEKALVARADERDMAHIGLETPASQIGIFDALPEATQERYLASVLDQLPTVKTDLAAMVEAWKAGDADTLAGLINDAEADVELLEMLLIRRNRTWAGWISNRLQQPGTVFMAVGAGHLAGIGSVQDQLATAGIVAERVQ